MSCPSVELPRDDQAAGSAPESDFCEIDITNFIRTWVDAQGLDSVNLRDITGAVFDTFSFLSPERRDAVNELALEAACELRSASRSTCSTATPSSSRRPRGTAGARKKAALMAALNVD